MQNYFLPCFHYITIQVVFFFFFCKKFKNFFLLGGGAMRWIHMESFSLGRLHADNVIANRFHCGHVSIHISLVNYTFSVQNNNNNTHVVTINADNNKRVLINKSVRDESFLLDNLGLSRML